MRTRSIPFLLLGVVAPLFAAIPVQAQPTDPYLAAVAEHFGVAGTEAGILAEWSLPRQEIPVVLFVADRAGASRDALLVLRRRGQSWAAIAGRFQLDAGAFHYPIGTAPEMGVLAGVYASYSGTSRRQWSSIALSDEAIVALVNLRFIADHLRVDPALVASELSGAGTAVDAFRRLEGGD